MPTAPLRRCAEPGCRAFGMASRCPRHDRRNHPGVSRQARGYGTAYGRAREALIGQPCAMGLSGCTGRATTAQHTDDGRLMPACAHCNYADGARRARATGAMR